MKWDIISPLKKKLYVSTWNHLQKTLLRKKSKLQEVWAECWHAFRNMLYVFTHMLVGVYAEPVSERINK